MRSDAVISDCQNYRYTLTRYFGPDSVLARHPSEPVHVPGPGFKTALWIMLNPSTADAHQDDATIRRITGFSSMFGYDALAVVNLFAYRTKSPKVLKAAAAEGIDVIGESNDHWIERLALSCDGVICGWGTHGELMGRDRQVLALLADLGVELKCLALTSYGFPGHPLYLPNESRLLDFRRRS